MGADEDFIADCLGFDPAGVPILIASVGKSRQPSSDPAGSPTFTIRTPRDDFAQFSSHY
jgi:hypothetical protein